MAEALYRKYRPQVFSAVVGQEHIERTLKNAIEQDKVSHAYLFCGPRGTGKTTTARLLAKAMLCEQGPTSNPCGECAACVDIANGIHPDVYELDAASRTGVDNVRDEIISRVQFAPTRGGKKIYIIDEVHMLSVAAFNALLKTLEEPPEHVLFILCTTDPQKIPETILSRVQRFDFKRITNEGIEARLAEVCEQEHVRYDTAALAVLAQRSGGGMRNALTALEQAIACGEGEVSLEAVAQIGGVQDSCDVNELVDALAQNNVAQCFAWIDAYALKGGSFSRLALSLASALRDVYTVVLAGQQAPLHVDEAQKCKVLEQAQHYGAHRLVYMLDVLSDLLVQLKTATNERLCCELAVVKLARPESEVSLDALLARIERLERNGVSAAVPAGATLGAAGTAAASAAVPAAGTLGAAAASAAVPAAVTAVEPNAAASCVASGAAVSGAAAVVTVPAAEQQVSPAPTAISQAATQGLSGMSNPAFVQRVWSNAVKRVKQVNPASAEKIKNAKARYEQASNTLFVELSATSAVFASSLMKPATAHYLERMIAETSNVEVSVQVCMPASLAQVAAQTASKPAAPAIATESAATAIVAEPAPAASVTAEPAPTIASEPTPVVSAVTEPASTAVRVASSADATESSQTPAAAPSASEPVATPQTANHYDYEEVPLEVYDAYSISDFSYYDDDEDQAASEAPSSSEASHGSTSQAQAYANSKVVSPWDEEIPDDVPEGAEEFNELLKMSFGEELRIEEL